MRASRLFVSVKRLYPIMFNIQAPPNACGHAGKLPINCVCTRARFTQESRLRVRFRSYTVGAWCLVCREYFSGGWSTVMNQPTIHYPRSIEDTKRENCRRWARLKASLSLLRKVPGNPLCWRGGGTPRTLAQRPLTLRVPGNSLSC